MKELPETAPAKSERHPRLPVAARALKQGEYLDTTEPLEAASIVSFGRYKGWSMVRRTAGGKIRVWRAS